MKLENAVYWELRRRGHELYYYSDKGECDFIVRQGNTITQAYQVTVSLADLKTRKREIDGIIEAVDACRLPEGCIITLDESEDIRLPNERHIHVIPYYRWVLSQN